MFDYVQKMYDNISGDLLMSSFVINATINIAGTDIVHESTYSGMRDSLDGRHTQPVQQNYPLDMPKIIRVKVFPMEKTYLKKEGKPIEYGLAGKYEPFDRWISCLESDVQVRDNETYFDYTDTVAIEGHIYRLKAIHKESFGIKPIIHAFLVREYDE